MSKAADETARLKIEENSEAASRDVERKRPGQLEFRARCATWAAIRLRACGELKIRRLNFEPKIGQTFADGWAQWSFWRAVRGRLPTRPLV